ncbi:MAG: FAD-dependent monooxygenase [Rickettsiaceae bacterium]|nr:FAD-dependent monooxygenase [Rickettsiaceae bacterium]
MNPRITIIGCGLSGMITALCFAARDINSIIIERQNIDDQSFFNDIRTTALTESSKKFFEDIGIWNEIDQISGPINDIYVADNKASQMLHFASNELKKKQVLGYLVENKEFKKSLLAHVTVNKHINIIDNSHYEVKENSNNKCILTLNETDHEFDLLIVCDGGNSLTRQKYFSSETNKSYSQYALTFIVQHENPHEGTAVEHFMPTGPFAILPLKNQHFSSVVWTIKSDMKNAVLNLPKDEFSYIIQQNFGQFLGKITIKSEIASFPLRAYGANKYYNKRIALVADSAHIIHPLAGQGLNQGIKDIQSIVSNILELGINSHSLETYQKERKSDNNAMIEITDTINTVFSNNSQIFHLARQFGFKAIEKISPLKKLLIKYAMGQRK